MVPIPLQAASVSIHTNIVKQYPFLTGKVGPIWDLHCGRGVTLAYFERELHGTALLQTVV